MPKPVEIPGVGRFEFPDSMSMDDIAAVIERDVAPMVRERKQKREGMVAEQRALEAEPEPSVAAMTAEGFGNRVVEFGKGVVRGAAEAAIAVPEAIGVGSAALASATGVGESDPNKLATYNFAQGARKALDAVMPMDPELADEFVTGKLSQGFGAMLGMGGVSTLATKGTMAIGKKGTELAMQSAAKRAMTIAGAETGAALGGAEGYRRALRAGSTPEEAFTSFFLNSLVGTTEAITLGKLFTRADKALGGELKSLLLTSGKEAGQEGFQATMANVIAKYATPEEVEVMKGVAEEAGAGGIVGFMAQALGLKFRPRGKDGIPILGPNEVIEAFDQSTKSDLLLGTAREGSAFEPSPKGKMATPEALARANELQMVSAAAAERPEGMVGPETLGPLTSDKYRREIIIQADDLLNTFKQAQQRNAERGAGGKMAPGEPAIEGAVPGFAKTAEDKLAGRDVPEIAPGIPEIAPGTPLKAVEDIIRDKLRRKDIKEAVGVLLQVPIETSGKIIDNVLRIKEKSVPLSAGELTIFNELWDATLEKMGAKVSNIPVLGKDDVIEAPPQATAEEIPALGQDEVIEGPAAGPAKTELPQSGRVSVNPETDEFLGTNDRGEPIYWSIDAKTHYSVSDGKIRTGPWTEGLTESASERLVELYTPAPATETARMAEGFKVVPGAGANITMLEGVEFEVNPERLLSTPPAIKRADGTIVVGDGHAKLKEQLKPLLKAGEKLTGGYVSSKTGEFLSLTEVVRAIEEEKAGDAAGAKKKFAVNSPEVKAAVEETPSVQVLKRQVAKAEADMLSREQDHKAAQRDQNDSSRNAPNYSEYVRRTKTAKTSMESAKSNVEQAQSKLDAERARKAPFVRIELNKAAQPSAAAAAKKSKVDAVVDKLQSLKTPLLPGLGSTPFPQIARAVWNTAIDIAIAAVKAGGSVTSGINAAIAHLKKNASGYDEVAVRDHLSMIVRGEAQAKAGAAAASVVSDKPSVGAPIPAKGEAFREPGPQIRGKVGDLYSEPLVERLGRVGGPVAKTVTRENLEIVARAKQLYGEISADFLDTARRVAGQAFRGGSTWVQGVRKISGNAGISKFHEIIETRAETGNWDHVPPKFRESAAIWYDANMAIGRMAEKANPLFKAGGKVQRILTSYGYDIVKRGGGKAWNMWSEALADVNGKSVDDTRQFLTKWKTELDKPGADATHLDKLAQDFKRQFPKVVTHIRPAKGMGWHAIVQSNPFSYLEQAAQRTANAVAFREVYPLAEKEGKYESSGKLEATRAAVQAEIDTNKYGNEFDNVMKALQGHPLDSITQWWMAPDSVTGAAYRALGEVTAPMRALMLSASAAVNVVETLMGGAHIFNGYGPAFKAMLRSKTLFAQLKRSGMLNASIKDFSFDPSAPIRSLSRMMSNILSRGFMSEFLNEFQEFTGASSARIVADEIRAGTMSATDKQNVISTMRAMGIDTKSAKEAVEGRSPKTVQVFETKAAAFLSSGNTATAERSRLGASRFFNSLFWFHSYPMMKLNQLRSLYNNLNESVRTGDKPQQWADAKKISRYIFGTGLQGAGTLILMRLLTERMAGLETLDKEAEDDPLAFVMNSFIQGMGGPLALAARLFERVGGVQSLASEVVGSMAPVGVVGELWDMAAGNGKYDGADFMSKVGLFIRSKTPAMRLAKSAVATLGLAKNSADLDAAISAFRRWKREEKGQLKITNELKDQEDQAKFRFHMGKVVEAMKKNDLDAYMKQMGAALSIREFEEMSYKEQQKSISSSLRSRKLLSKLEDEDLENLRKRIGDNAFQRLIDYDDMLEIEAK